MECGSLTRKLVMMGLMWATVIRLGDLSVVKGELRACAHARALNPLGG